MTDLRYPIGKFMAPDVIDDRAVQGWIDELERFPADMRAAVERVGAEGLERTYRPGGWTARQVVHHVADSHMHSVVRFKWALTEDLPTIKAYDEQAVAELVDYRAPVASSLALLEALHARWVLLLRGLTREQWEREFVHPESGQRIGLRLQTAIYAWHGKHHRAHVELAGG